MSATLSAVVVAAGRSRRMGFDKLLTELAGHPLLLHTLNRMSAVPQIDEIILVIRPDIEEQVRELFAEPISQQRIRLVHGGELRQDSVRNGLAEVSEKSEYVLIHDAARPFITEELVTTVLAAAIETGAAVCGTPSSDTLKEVTADGIVTRTLDRSVIWGVQTPQIFRKSLLLDAYNHVAATGAQVTDDTAAVELFGQPVKVVHYPGLNMKVTTPSDWNLATCFLVMGEPDTPTGQEVRKLLHDLNNHLTPLMGYSFLIGNEFAEGSKGKRYAQNIQTASEKCTEVSSKIQKIARELFPRKDEKQGPEA